MQINIADIWSSEVEKQHRAFVSIILSRSFPPRNPIMNQLLLRHGEQLALSRPDNLRSIINDIEKSKNTYPVKIREEFDSDCKTIFDYSRFSTKGEKHWNAYKLCSSSKYRLCPYCQQSLAVTIYRDNKSKSLRPTLDHYYPRHKYPYLALSLYNLIPSCHPCNSSLKGKIDFFKKQHLHPYEDQEIIQYDLDIESYIQLRQKGNESLPDVTIRKILNTHDLFDRAQRSMKTFLTEERLAISQSEIKRFIETLIFYSADRVTEVNKIFSRLGYSLSNETVLNFSRENYKDEWLGSIKRDLYDTGWNR